MMSRNVRNLIHKTVVLVMLVLVMGSNSIANAGTGALSDTNWRFVKSGAKWLARHPNCAKA
jgi:hypothetical protein